MHNLCDNLKKIGYSWELIEKVLQQVPSPSGNWPVVNLLTQDNPHAFWVKRVLTSNHLDACPQFGNLLWSYVIGRAWFQSLWDHLLCSRAWLFHSRLFECGPFHAKLIAEAIRWLHWSNGLSQKTLLLFWLFHPCVCSAGCSMI